MSEERTARAAILAAPGEDVTVVDAVLDAPAADEVIVRVAASGVCHTDLHVKQSGGWGMTYPILLGHEGAGYVEEVGERVEGLAPGTPAVIAWRAPCGRCPACRRGDPRRCNGHLQARSRLRRASDGARLAPTLRTGTFTTRTVVHAAQVVPLPAGVPMTAACLLACGVSTGAGAALQTSPVWPGATVAVIGCGGVGLSVVAGARIAGAARVIAVDIAPQKLDWAVRFGATDTVDASAGDAVTAVRDLTGGSGVNFAFEATGRPQPVEQAVRMLAHAGVATMVGVQAEGATATLDLGGADLGVFENKATLTVSHGGDSLPAHDFPVLARYYLEGRLDLDAMVTKTIGLDDVEAAFADMAAGRVIRSVIVFE